MIEYLLENTQNTIIAALRRTSQAILSNLKGVLDNPRVKLVTLDLCDGEAIRRLIREEKPDYFCNFGAQTFVADSWSHPVAHMQTNAISLIHILEGVREYAPNCRVYSAGSSEEFGKVEYSPQDEKHPRIPRSVYGVSKVAAEHICKVYRESYGLYVVHGILFNHESPRRQDYFVTRKITKGVARIARAIKDGYTFNPIELGNMDAKRDWSHAKDFVDGVWRMLNQEKYRSHCDGQGMGSYYGDRQEAMTDGSYNDEWYEKWIAHHLSEYVLSSNETHTVREFVEKAFFHANIRGQWKGSGKDEVYKQVIEGVRGTPSLVIINPEFYRPNDVELLHGDSSRARAELGWSPRYSFDDLVREMVKNDLREVGL